MHNRKINYLKSIIFLVLLCLILWLLSAASISMDKDVNPLYNHSAHSMLSEPRNSIDVIAIGDSSVYSSISPLEWWDEYGITGYAWSEPSQRISETYEYLKTIYKYQSPSVVFIEVNNMFRDPSDIDNLDSMTKASLAQIFPVITFHKNLDPHKLQNLKADSHSLTKGYFFRLNHKKVHKNKKRMKQTTKCKEINWLSKHSLRKCVTFCQQHHSSVVLLSVPNYNSWNMAKHNALEKLSDEYQVPFLDLNLDLKNTINWKKSSADGGSHLNATGAKITSAYLGTYLKNNFLLPDHRKDSSYQQWNKDLMQYRQAVSFAEKNKDR